MLEDPVSYAERDAIARTCMTKLALEPIPALVDGMDDAVNLAYVAHPDRLYLVGKDGRIALHGFEGPMGFDVDALERAIRDELAR